MEDRHLYRGKMLNGGKWVQGFFSKITKGAYHNPVENETQITTIEELDNGEIILTGIHAVDPDTVGQCTGLTDKNGAKVFEGDRVKDTDDTNLIGTVRWGVWDTQTDYGRLGFYIEWNNTEIKENILYWVNRGIEVIGNIHTQEDE